MKTRSRRITLALLTCAGVLILGGTASAQTLAEATAQWGAPTAGTPVVHYILQISINDGEWEAVANVPDTTYDLDLEVGQSYRVRVAGVDAEGRQGPFSLPSEPYAPLGDDPGPPGAPGQPIPL